MFRLPNISFRLKIHQAALWAAISFAQFVGILVCFFAVLPTAQLHYYGTNQCLIIPSDPACLNEQFKNIGFLTWRETPFFWSSVTNTGPSPLSRDHSYYCFCIKLMHVGIGIVLYCLCNKFYFFIFLASVQFFSRWQYNQVIPIILLSFLISCKKRILQEVKILF